MENSEMTTENLETMTEEMTEQEVELTSLLQTETTTTTTTECQLSTSQPIYENINVEQLNTFTYLGIGFILGCILVFGLKVCYRFFRIFF